MQGTSLVFSHCAHSRHGSRSQPAMDQERKATENFILIQYVYIAMSVTYLLLGLRSNSKLLKLVLKCAPIATLLGLIVYTAFNIFNSFGALSFGNTLNNLWCLFWGILFSLLGDMYLVFDSTFLLGIVSFSITQAIYANFFDGTQLLLMISTGLEQQQIITALAIGLVSAIFYCYVYPKLSWIISVLGLLYSLLISTMLWAAITRAQLTPSTPNLTAVVGACLFYLSDLLLALNKWRLKTPIADIVVIVTYYGAQLLIVRSVFIP